MSPPGRPGPAGERALEGWRVVVTRCRDDAEALASPLARAGATVLLFPTIVRVPPRSLGPLDRALARIAAFHWLVFTSPQAARVAFARLRRLRAGPVPPIAAIGADTARALEELGHVPALVPEVATAEALAAALRAGGVEGKRLLFPRAREGRDVVPALLAAAGAQVTVATAYETRCAPRPAPGRRRRLAGVHAILFTSPSTVRCFERLAGRREARRLLQEAVAGAIGPTTRWALAPLAPREVVVPARPSIEGLVAALEARAARGLPDAP